MITLLLASTMLSACNTAVVAQPAPKTIYDFTMPDITGKEVKLSKFKGKVLLVVNVASHCGFTPQYKGLEALYKEKKKDGLVVLGFPANNFNSQEPGSNEEIIKFCTATYDVTFPMFSKISVKGDDSAPLYNWLRETADRHDDIEWNFAKFVIGRDGKVFKRFTSKDTPESEAVTSAINEALAAK